MKIKEIVIENFRTYKEATTVTFDDFNCIVGKNDVGKSTILKALDWFFNDTKIDDYDRNIDKQNEPMSVEITFDDLDYSNKEWNLEQLEGNEVEEEQCDEAIDIDSTSYSFIDNNEFMKKLSVNICKYSSNDSSNKFRMQVRCSVQNENTLVIKRNNAIRIIDICQQIYELYQNGQNEIIIESNGSLNEFDWSEWMIYNRDYIPKFIYFNTSTTLKEYLNWLFKITFYNKKFNDQITEIKTNIAANIKDKLPQKYQKETIDFKATTAKIDFFVDENNLLFPQDTLGQKNIPITNRGDGFQLEIKNAVCRLLADQQNSDMSSAIFAFEEPETHLHPSAQVEMYDAIRDLSTNPKYQVIITTHSPTLVSQCNSNNIIQVVKNENDTAKVRQYREGIVNDVIKDLGITNNDLLASLYDSNKCLFLVEGADDVKAFSHVCEEYKKNGKIDHTFAELGCVIIPIGGCDSIKHWATFKIIKQLHKKFFIVLDNDSGKNEQKLNQLLPNDTDKFKVLNKLEIENYIPCTYFQTLNPPINISYGDNDDVKTICKTHRDSVRLGGKRVCDIYFTNLSYFQLRSTFCPTGIDSDDEFLEIYEKIKNLCSD